MNATHPLTMGEYDALTPKQRREWTQRWLAGYIAETTRREMLAEIGSFAEREFHMDWGSSDEC